MTCWLLVERIENWKIDLEDGFSRYGVSARYQKLATQVRTGDCLFFYISSGISKFAGIREAAADGFRKLPLGGDYDTAFPIAIATKPLLTLNQAVWVPMQELASRLSFTRGKDWRQTMRASFRRLPQEDAHIIKAAMEAACKREA